MHGKIQVILLCSLALAVTLPVNLNVGQSANVYSKEVELALPDLPDKGVFTGGYYHGSPYGGEPGGKIPLGKDRW